MNDAQLLASVPEHIQFDCLLKASPAQEGDRRIIYFEASNEDPDHQDEVVLQKALADSAAYFLRHGNIDIGHYTLLKAKSGVQNFLDYEIGRPLDARVDGRRTWVKAELYRGDSPQAKTADMVWHSMTAQQPPMRWYPSVGGAVMAKSIRMINGKRLGVVDKVMWNNVALDRCPVSKTVGTASAAPVGVFAKSLGAFVVSQEPLSKMLTAGYGADPATLTGGGALRMQSLDPVVKLYMQVRDPLAAALMEGQVAAKRQELVDWASTFLKVDARVAAACVDRFLGELRPVLMEM